MKRLLRTPAAAPAALVAGLAWCLQASVAGAVTYDDLAVCAGIHAKSERLACYDKLAADARQSPPAGPSAGAAPAPPATAVAPVYDEKTFGLTKQQQHLPAESRGPDSLQAGVSRITTDTTGKAVMTLDNGQTWTFSGAESLLRPGDMVTIKQASLGAYVMTTPTRRSYHVRRIQ